MAHQGYSVPDEKQLLTRDTTFDHCDDTAPQAAKGAGVRAQMPWLVPSAVTRNMTLRTGVFLVI